MNCRKCRAELERYLDNELAQGERVVVEQHLAACADCRQKLSELQALNSVLQARPGVEPGLDYLAGFNDRFWHEVKRRRRMRSVAPERRFLPVFWTRIAATAAAALLVIAVGLVGYRSWHTLFEHPAEALRETVAPQAVLEAGKAAEAATPKPVARAAARTEDVEAEKQPESEPAAAGEMARSAPPPALVQVQPGQADAQALSPGLEMKTASGGARGMSAQKLEVQPAPPPVVSGSGQGYAGAKKGGLKLADEKPVKKSGPAPGQEIGGIKAQVLDTVIYSEEKLSVKPVLVSIPDASDDDRMKYPNMEVPVWVVIEKDGSVSRAESRATTANAGLEHVALGLARQAQFTPGKRAGNAVRVGKTIVVKVKALKHKDD
jgi:hypothetical protein